MFPHKFEENVKTFAKTMPSTSVCYELVVPAFVILAIRATTQILDTFSDLNCFNYSYTDTQTNYYLIIIY